MTKKNKPSQLTSHTGYWLRLISNTVSHSFARKLDSSSVTVAEWVILREMYGNENKTISPSDVADMTGLSRGAVSKLITRLINKKLINRNESSDDRRYQEVKLTGKALALVPELAGLADKNDEDFFSCLSETEHRQLVSTLKKLSNHHQIKTIPVN